jgi:hypothetical protein
VSISIVSPKDLKLTPEQEETSKRWLKLCDEITEFAKARGVVLMGYMAVNSLTGQIAQQTAEWSGCLSQEPNWDAVVAAVPPEKMETFVMLQLAGLQQAALLLSKQLMMLNAAAQAASDELASDALPKTVQIMYEVHQGMQHGARIFQERYKHLFDKLDEPKPSPGPPDGGD